MPMQQIRRRNRVDLQLEWMGQICLERKFQCRHNGIGQFVIGRPVYEHRAGCLREKIKEPFRHVLVQRRQHC
jgi:hypothetical protein